MLNLAVYDDEAVFKNILLNLKKYNFFICQTVRRRLPSPYLRGCMASPSLIYTAGAGGVTPCIHAHHLKPRPVCMTGGVCADSQASAELRAAWPGDPPRRPPTRATSQGGKSSTPTPAGTAGAALLGV